MSLDKIKQQLEKLNTVKEKLNYLEDVLESLDNKEELDFVNKTIKELNELLDTDDILEDSPLLESELNNNISSSQTIIQEEQPITRRNESLESALSEIQIKNDNNKDQSSYADGNYGMSFNANYSMTDFQDFSSPGNSFASGLRDKFIREGILTHDGANTPEDRESLRSKLRNMFPGSAEESILKYESDIINAQNSNRYEKKLT